MKPSKKALFAGFANKAFEMETTRIELATSGLQSREHRVSSANPSEVTARADSRCTIGCTSSPENERAEAVGESVPSKADHSVVSKSESFSAALAMIASLPLSNAEKADAVRRILAEQDGSEKWTTE